MVQISLEHYMSERKTITKEIMKSDAQKWEEVVQSNDAKTFWQYIDWKGNLKRKKTNQTLLRFSNSKHFSKSCINVRTNGSCTKS